MITFNQCPKNVSCGMSYPNILFVAELTSLESRRYQLSMSFFQYICQPSSSVYRLLPFYYPVYTTQPVVKSGCQPVGCLFTRYSQFENRLYRVNGAM